MAEIDNKLQSPDYTSPEQSGDFRLKEISIHSPSNDQAQLLDTPSVFVELDIFEDLFSNVIKGTYTFLDTQGYAETIPLVGEGIVTWLWGGYSVDNPTLTRFFSLHYLFPFIILGLVVLHIWALHVPGNNNPVGIDIKKPSKDTVPFHPYITIKDLFALLIFIIIFSGFIFFSPNILGHPDNYIPANPLVTPTHIVPEWYLLPFYAILRSVPDKLGGVILMFGSLFIPLILPWLDSSKVRSAVFRPIYRIFFWVLIIDLLALGYVGAMPAEGLYLLIARVGTAYYFIHFLVILPLLSRIEKTDPLPISISEPVLTGMPKPEMMRKDKTNL